MYDVVIIGGGITGAGLLRDCSLRGLKALAVDKSDPGRATTFASTHLIHGGLRYLLYDRLTTHTTSWDAGNIVRIAEPLLTRLPIVWPLYKGQTHGPETVETLLESYDYFQRMKCGMPHLRLDAAQTARLFPDLKTEGLRGAISFDEWWVDAVDLTRQNIADGERRGGLFRSNSRVVGLLRGDSGSVTGVRIESGGKAEDIRAKVVVNAAGPWVDSVAAMAGIDIPLRLQKGTHLVYDKALLPAGLLLEAVDRGRYVFVIPFKGGTLVGPTDIAHAGSPDDVRTDGEEIRYLIDSVRRYIPDFPEEYAGTRVGTRPILGQAGSEKLLSREYAVFDHADAGAGGLVTVAGGKMSDFRLMAKDTVDLVCRKLDKDAPCTTHQITLSGKPVTTIPNFPRPSRGLKRFLRRHPRIRELHALAYLGAGLLRHLFRRLTGGLKLSDAQAFQEHYGYYR